jgi:tetratricopeptide (TPR) repeat protein
MSALGLALALLLHCAPQAAAEGARERVAAWREALEIDAAAEVLREGPPAVAEGGALAGDGEALSVVARALFAAGREAEAEALLASARPAPGGEAWIELARARMHLERDELEQAIALASVEGSTLPRARLAESAEAWLLLGRALVRSGRDADARFALEQGYELEPLGEGAYAALYALSQIALRAGDGARAQELVARQSQVGQWRAYLKVRRQQVRESPDEPLPRLGLAQLWLQAGQHARALEELDRLTARFPDYAPGWFQRGEALRALERYDEARAAYDLALERDGELAQARYNRAVLHLRAGRAAEARADFERIVNGAQAQDPRLLPAHLGLARLLLAAGEGDAARERHARYVELGGREPLEP